MGLFDRRNERKRLQEQDEWDQQVVAVRDMVAVAHDWIGDPITSDSGLIAKSGELGFAILPGAALIEPRRQPGQWSGRSQGVSFPVYKGIRYRVGATKGTFQQGAEVPTPIDSGVVLISNQRVVFAGEKATREWLFSKLIGFHHDEQRPWTALHVSNRQKVSGFLYSEETLTLVRFRFELALAVYHGTREAFVGSMETQLAALLAEKPETFPVGESSRPALLGTSEQQPGATGLVPVEGPVTGQPMTNQSAGPLPPADWYPNPDAPGLRYWNGLAWTQDFAQPDENHPDPVV